MLILAGVGFLVLAFTIHGNEILRNCYEDYQECVSNSSRTDHVNVEQIGSNNLIEFCSDHTQNILPCLARKVIHSYVNLLDE